MYFHKHKEVYSAFTTLSLPWKNEEDAQLSKRIKETEEPQTVASLVDQTLISVEDACCPHI